VFRIFGLQNAPEDGGLELRPKSPRNLNCTPPLGLCPRIDKSGRL
jgi:hypothetical protein